MADGYYTLDMKCQMIIDDFDAKLPIFVSLGSILKDEVRNMLSTNSVEVTAIEMRIKKRDSLIGKLQRKGYKYNSLDDITDIVGVRIITLYSDDVDRVASLLSNIFNIDWAFSIDKRKMHEMSSFGYNSLHYVCTLPDSFFKDGQHPELKGLRFEIQMRSTLQHAWAAMEHDIGYKSNIETPPEYIRMLGRLAGMLEMVDEEFSRIRISVAAHRRQMEQLIHAGELSKVTLDGDTFESFMALNPLEPLIQRIAAINQGEIQRLSFAPFFPVLVNIGMKNLQDVDDFIHKNEEDAYTFAMKQFAETDIDIIASTVAMQDLLIVDILKKGGGIAGLKYLYNLLNGESKHNERLAEQTYMMACKLPFLQKNFTPEKR